MLAVDFGPWNVGPIHQILALDSGPRNVGPTFEVLALDYGPWTTCTTYGVVPKGLLTFLGCLYKDVMRTIPGTLVYRFERQTATKKVLPSKNTVSST